MSFQKSCAGGELLMGLESRMLLQQALHSSDAAVRMRALHLLMSAAAQAPGSMHTLRTSGTAPNQPLMICGLQQPQHYAATAEADAMTTSLGLAYFGCCLEGAAK
jgi:hypothetical protein